MDESHKELMDGKIQVVKERMEQYASEFKQKDKDIEGEVKELRDRIKDLENANLNKDGEARIKSKIAAWVLTVVSGITVLIGGAICFALYNAVLYVLEQMGSN